MSIFEGRARQEDIAKQAGRIKKAFPSLTPGFYEIFIEMITQEKISCERLEKAVNYVIKNCVYPTPTVANFLQYDEKVKLYMYEDLQQMKDFHQAFKVFRPVQIEGENKPLYASKSDIKEYDLKPWDIKEKYLK